MILNWNVEHQSFVFIFVFNFQQKLINNHLATNNPEYHNFFHHFFFFNIIFLIKIKIVHIKNAHIIDYFKKIQKLHEKQEIFTKTLFGKFVIFLNFVAFSLIMHDFFSRIFPDYLTKIHPTLVPFLLPVWHMTITGSDYLNLAAVVERLLVRFFFFKV